MRDCTVEQDWGMSHTSAVFVRFTLQYSVYRLLCPCEIRLTISQHLVKMMGGEIKIDSKLGVGSRFQFSITVPVVHIGNTKALPSALRCVPFLTSRLHPQSE